LSDKKSLVDLGCGSGILSVIAKETGNYSGQISLIDSNEAAINCSKMNLALYGVFENQVISKNADIVDIWFPSSGTPDAAKRPKQQEFYDNIL
jgi:16S rRNA G1207 methylase RsmC